ncbi:MAG: M14 family metallopeptidase [Candidatus Choladocola sp.]|nr:M14 family metallopeptidase [Candidatus Choladocola sp.]
MEQKILFEIKALYRDDFRVTGFSFGHGEKSVCIVGSMRGNENQQLYACSQLIRKLRELEEKGRLEPDREILVIPCVNPYSMNIKKRFWSIDNTDINRMFPGYALGETTQRIAAGVFEAIKDYTYGIQFASFYMPGAFVPHIRMMKTGFENVDLARKFGLPYVVLHAPRPFDTTTLNYNWQIWETNAFSVYTTNTASIDRTSAHQAVEAILNFMSKQGIIRYHGRDGYVPQVIESSDFVSVRAENAGFFESCVKPGEEVFEGQLLAHIWDPYLATLRCSLFAPVYGTVAFVHDEAMTYENTAVLKLIREER